MHRECGGCRALTVSPFWPGHCAKGWGPAPRPCQPCTLHWLSSVGRRRACLPAAGRGGAPSACRELSVPLVSARARGVSRPGCFPGGLGPLLGLG